jgi:hypothetical protein
LLPKPHLLYHAHRLSDGVPDVLDEAVALGETVESIVALAHGPNETAQGIDVVLALDGTAVLVNLGDRNLDRGVILGLDDAVGGAALARDVTVDEESQLRVPSFLVIVVNSTGEKKPLQVDDLALVVLHCCGCGVGAAEREVVFGVGWRSDTASLAGRLEMCCGFAILEFRWAQTAGLGSYRPVVGFHMTSRLTHVISRERC